MNRASAMNEATDTSPRAVSPLLTIGIFLAPPIFAWFLLRKGYSVMARTISFSWMAVLLGLSQVPQAATEGDGGGKVAGADRPGQEELSRTAPAATPGAQASSGPGSATAKPQIDVAAERTYIDLLDESSKRMRSEGLVVQKEHPQITWATSLSLIDGLVTAYTEGAKVTLGEAGLERRQDFRRELAALQVKDFPQIRLLQARALDEVLWELDTDVEATGPAYATLRFTGYHFATNRNIKGVMEQVHEDALAGRFRRAEFRSYRGGPITSYTLAPIADDRLATFRFNRWTPID